MIDTVWASVAVVALLGLCVGSFLNVVIYRLPRMLEQQWQSECQSLLDQSPAEPPQRINLATPRSACPHCNTTIKARHNIPLLSWLLLRGRCAYCSAAISPRYPAVELLTALVSAFVAFRLGLTPAAAAALIFSWALIALIFIDADTFLLPDNITLPLLWLGLLANSQGMFAPLLDAVYGAAAGYLLLWSVYWAFKLLTGKEGMGFGDFKLLAALGAWLGWQALPLILLLAATCGAILGSLLLWRAGKGREQAIPFGPYLAIAGWIVFFWQQQLLSSYYALLGLG